MLHDGKLSMDESLRREAWRLVIRSRKKYINNILPLNSKSAQNEKVRANLPAHWELKPLPYNPKIRKWVRVTKPDNRTDVQAATNSKYLGASQLDPQPSCRGTSYRKSMRIAQNKFRKYLTSLSTPEKKGARDSSSDTIAAAASSSVDDSPHIENFRIHYNKFSLQNKTELIVRQ